MKMQRRALRGVFGAVTTLLVLTGTAAAAGPDFGGMKSCESKVDVRFRQAETVTADIDKDGDLDILAFGADATAWIENNNGTWIDHPINNPSNEDILQIAVGDIDGDGDVDLASVDVLGEVAWFENLGGGKSFDKHKIPAGASLSGKLIGIGDMDGDGKLDIIIGGGKGAQWLKNSDGKGGQWAAPEQVFDVTKEVKELFIADIDKDGKTDVALVTYYTPGGLHFVRNTGGAKFEAKLVDPKSGSSSNDSEYQMMIMADVNKDGHPDFIAFEGSKVSLLENVGGKAIAKSIVHDNQGLIDSYGLAVGDYDNDGDVDILFARQTSLSWMENDAGKWTERPFFKNDQASDSFLFVTVVDVGQDGDVDVVASQTRLGNGLFWIENKTTARGATPNPDNGNGNPAPPSAPGSEQPGAASGDDKGGGGGCSQASTSSSSRASFAGTLLLGFALLRRRWQRTRAA